MAVLDFEMAMPNTGSFRSAGVDLGLGTAEILTTELLRTGCFQLLERKRIKAVQDEIRLGQSEFFDQGTVAQIGNLLGAEAIVTGSITDFEPEISGTELSIRVPRLGGIEAGLTYSYVGLELRMIEVRTGSVLHSVRASEYSRNVGGGAGFSLFGFDLQASSFSRTPLGNTYHRAVASAIAGLIEGSTEAPSQRTP